MTVRLRPHHLLCILTYVGKGYTPAFVRRLDEVAERLAGGDEVLLVDGPDDVCAPMQGVYGAHCRRSGIVGRDDQARRALADFLGRSLTTGTGLVLDAPTVSRLREAFAAGTIRAACAGCQWDGLCTALAATGFPGIRFRPLA